MIEGSHDDHLARFAGLPVREFPKWETFKGEWAPKVVTSEPGEYAWRVSGCWDAHPYLPWFERFLAEVDTTQVKAFIIGDWQTWKQSAEVIFAPLIAAADRFPSLEALFLADIEQNVSEISWIQQSDVTPLVRAFPKLKVFGARGSNGLGWQPGEYRELRELTFQSGGLPPRVVRALAESDFPQLTELELYLGDADYFGGATVDDLAPILLGDRLPNLRHLGLRDAENADEIAAALAYAPIVARLEVLDLSLGTLGDEGVAALLAGQPLTHLRVLDLHHHFITEPMQERLRQALPGVELDLDDGQEPDEDEDDGESWRYVAVSE